MTLPLVLVFVLNFSYLSEEVFKAPREEAPRFFRVSGALNCEGLAAAGLPVGEDAAVEPLET